MILFCQIVPAIVMPPLIQVLIDFQKKNKPKELSADLTSGVSGNLNQVAYKNDVILFHKPFLYDCLKIIVSLCVPTLFKNRHYNCRLHVKPTVYI